MPDGGPVGTAAETDGGMLGASGDLDVSVLGVDVPDQFGSFLPIFAMMATGEFGDKTQLVTIGLAVQYGAHSGIWVGEMLVIVPVSVANAYFFSTFSGRFDARKAHVAGAVLFFSSVSTPSCRSRPGSPSGNRASASPRRRCRRRPAPSRS